MWELFYKSETGNETISINGNKLIFASPEGITYKVHKDEAEALTDALAMKIAIEITQ